MYNNGEGVPEDDIQAYAWLNLAAAQGKTKAGKFRGLIKKKMSHSQIAEGQKLSRKLFKRISKKK